MTTMQVGEARQWRGVIMVIGATLGWGTMAAVAKVLFRHQGVDPLLLVVVRAYLATLVLFLALRLIAPDHLKVDRRMLRAAAVVGIGGLLTNNFLYFEAINLTSVATALLLQYQAPILVALYVLLVQRQRLSGRLFLSLALTLAGCALASSPMVSNRPNASTDASIIFFMLSLLCLCPNCWFTSDRLIR